MSQRWCMWRFRLEGWMRLPAGLFWLWLSGKTGIAIWRLWFCFSVYRRNVVFLNRPLWVKTNFGGRKICVLLIGFAWFQNEHPSGLRRSKMTAELGASFIVKFKSEKCHFNSVRLTLLQAQPILLIKLEKQKHFVGKSIYIKKYIFKNFNFSITSIHVPVKMYAKMADDVCLTVLVTLLLFLLNTQMEQVQKWHLKTGHSIVNAQKVVFDCFLCLSRRWWLID